MRALVCKQSWLELIIHLRRFVSKHKLIEVYTMHVKTMLHMYSMSPNLSTIRIEEITNHLRVIEGFSWHGMSLKHVIVMDQLKKWSHPPPSLMIFRIKKPSLVDLDYEPTYTWSFWQTPYYSCYPWTWKHSWSIWNTPATRTNHELVRNMCQMS